MIPRQLAAGLISLAGTVFVLASVTLLNRFVTLEQNAKEGPAVNFSVPTVQARPQAPRPPEPARRPPRSTPQNLAPLPDLGTGLSSIVVDTPDFLGGDLAGAGNELLGQLDDVAMTADTVDRPPVVRNSALTYPAQARSRGIEGRVVVSVLIGVDGRIQRSQILESVPPGVFDQAVLESLPRWSFVPAEYKGRPVQIWATLPLDFSLR